MLCNMSDEQYYYSVRYMYVLVLAYYVMEVMKIATILFHIAEHADSFGI
jgi:hypothetical protein